MFSLIGNCLKKLSNLRYTVHVRYLHIELSVFCVKCISFTIAPTFEQSQYVRADGAS